MRTHIFTILLMLLATIFLAACDKSVTSVNEEREPGPPSSVRIISGDQQYGFIETELPEPLVIEIVDASGISVPGVEVEWSTNGGNLESVSERTDTLGIARARWVLPDKAGEYKVQVLAGAAERTIQARATDFTLSCSPEQVKIPRGSSVAVLCSLEPLGGFEGASTFSLLNSQLPPGIDIDIESEELHSSLEGRTATLIRLSAEESANGTGSVTLEATSTQYNKSVSATFDVELVQKRPEVRLIYLVPKDREAHQIFPRVIERMGRHLQHWISDQLGDGRTFSLNQTPVEIYKTGREADSYAFTENGQEVHGFWNNVVTDGLSLTGGSIDDPDNIWVFLIDAQPLCDQTRAAAALHVTVLDMENNIRSLNNHSPRQRCEKEDRSAGPQSLWIGTLGHELGHNLELPHPPGCNQGEQNCDSEALMWLGTWNYPDTYLRNDEQTTLRTSRFVTGVSVPDEIFLPEKLQDNGVYLHSASEKSKFFHFIDPTKIPSRPLSCQISAFQNLAADTSRGPSW